MGHPKVKRPYYSRSVGFYEDDFKTYQLGVRMIITNKFMRTSLVKLSALKELVGAILFLKQ